MSIQMPPPLPGPDVPTPPPDDPAPPADPPAPDPQPPVEPDPDPLPPPTPPGVDAPLVDADAAGASLGEIVADEGLADVRVTIRDGRAVLRGVVEEPRLQDEAARLAFALDGVEAVENDIGLPSA